MLPPHETSFTPLLAHHQPVNPAVAGTGFRNTDRSSVFNVTHEKQAHGKNSLTRSSPQELQNTTSHHPCPARVRVYPSPSALGAPSTPPRCKAPAGGAQGPATGSGHFPRAAPTLPEGGSGCGDAPSQPHREGEGGYGR